MFERFTDRARRVVVLAQEEARILNHNYIGTEHILLGLIHDGEGVATTVLESLGIPRELVRSRVEEIIGHGQAPQSGHIPFTPRAKKVLELSLREALQLGHDYIGAEHILLGLIREGQGVAAQVLQKLGADLSRVRLKVIELLEAQIEETPKGTRYLRPFSEVAQEVLKRASESARELGHEAIEPADILLALVATDDAQVTELLGSWGIRLADVRQRIEELAAEEEGPAPATDRGD
jgi:ATP-dependent Clp protease ATP-binding subunit ClpA